MIELQTESFILRVMRKGSLIVEQPKKKHWGDRRDATRVRNCDAMHVIMPYIYPNRADNEAFIQESIDLTELNEYLEKKNASLDKAHRYTIFHCMACALVKTVTLRPRMNYFVQGSRLYSRDDVSVAFVVKKQFDDRAEEALAFKKFGPETTIDIFHDKIMQEIFECRRSDRKDNSTAGMDFFKKIPRWILKPTFGLFRWLDYMGWMPYSLVKTDPDYASIFISNLGSIKLNAAYHHLNNWGTNSVFVVIGQKHAEPKFNADGTWEMRDTLHFGITLDERIADGYYYSKTIQILKYIMEHPEELDKPACEEVAL